MYQRSKSGANSTNMISYQIINFKISNFINDKPRHAFNHFNIKPSELYN